MKNILFVCTGNTCRSSMAKGIMEKAIEDDEKLKNNITVDSSGIFAHPDDGASPNSIIVLKEEFGIDISSHKAKVFDPDIASKADIILTMTNSHKNTICNYYPDLKSKTYTLKEYVASKNSRDLPVSNKSGFDISDPYGMPLNIYKLCAMEIKAEINKLVEILKNESEI